MITTVLTPEDRLKNIGLFLAVLALVGLVVYGRHLATGVTPSNVIFSLFGLEVYWYGFLIMGGIALGAYVASRLAQERSLATLAAKVPAALREQPIAALDWPAELKHAASDCQNRNIR